jgi:hypothetical protein
MHHGIQNEECIREELSEKRCFAELLCQREAINFYHRNDNRGSGRKQKWSCSALVEKFAFPENELVLPDIISNEEREYCRQSVYDLARCLSKHGIGRSR